MKQRPALAYKTKRHHTSANNEEKRLVERSGIKVLHDVSKYGVVQSS